jgi:hypothetical protein
MRKMLRERGRFPAALALLASAFLLVAVLTVGVSSARGAHTATLANSVTFQDSTGEDPNSLDIGTVTVSNDDTGLVTFDVKFVNGSLNWSIHEFYVVMDTDRDESTGSPDTGGGDYVIAAWGPSVLLKWNGVDFDFAPSMKTLVTMVQPNGMIVRIHPSELGDVKGFDFYVKTYRPSASDPEDQWSDWAPDWDKWGYDIKLYVAPVLSATAVKCTPDPPRAGKAMIARTTVSVTRGGTQESLGTTATVKATATIAGKKVVGKVMPGYGSGKVAVKWVIPKAAKGKTMRGTITVTLEKVSVTKTFAGRIK